MHFSRMGIVAFDLRPLFDAKLLICARNCKILQDTLLDSLINA
jgi:hypothetical protein